MYLFFQLLKGDFSNYLTYSRGEKKGPAFKHIDGGGQGEKRRGCGSGVGPSRVQRGPHCVRCQGATVPGTAGVMRGLEALADTWWGRLRSSGGGGGVGVGQ